MQERDQRAGIGRLDIEIGISQDDYMVEIGHVKIIQEGAIVAGETARRMTRIQRSTLLADFRKGGMEIYDPTPAELALFRNAAQKPVLKFIREQVGDKLVDDLLKASEVSLKELGYTH